MRRKNRKAPGIKQPQEPETVVKLPDEFDDRFFSLLSIYNTEWCHRDDIMWKHVFAYFYAALVVIMAPYTKIIDEDCVANIKIVCHYAGYVLTVCMLFAGLCYGVRLSKIGNQYRRMVKLLPPLYQEKYIVKSNLLIRLRLAYVIPAVMALVLVALNLLVKHYLL